MVYAQGGGGTRLGPSHWAVGHSLDPKPDILRAQLEILKRRLSGGSTSDTGRSQDYPQTCADSLLMNDGAQAGTALTIKSFAAHKALSATNIGEYCTAT